MDFTEFSNKAKDGFNLIPLIKELDSIKKEAIDIYGDHFDQKKSFFFESLEGDKNWSRYTIIGCSSGDYLEVFGNKIKKYSNFLEESEYHDDNPINWIENYFSSYKVFIPKTLPIFLKMLGFICLCKAKSSSPSDLLRIISQFSGTFSSLPEAIIFLI